MLDEKQLHSGKVRSIEGGIWVRVSSAAVTNTENAAVSVLAQYTLRLTAVVGLSICKLSKKLVKLKNNGNGRLEGKFWIRNLSEGLPLRYELEPETGVTLTSTSEKADGAGMAGTGTMTGALVPGGSDAVVAGGFGL